MSNFLRAIRYAARRLDKTFGFNAPYGTQPYRSLRDVGGETKHILDSLDEDAGLRGHGTHADIVRSIRRTQQEADGISHEHIEVMHEFEKYLHKKGK